MAKETERDRLLRDMKDAGNQTRGFKSWWKNVFMYNYFKPVLIGIVAVALIALFVYDMTRDNEYDTTVTILANNYISEESRADMLAVLNVSPGDINGSGEAKIAIDDYAISTSSDSSTDAAQKIEVLQTQFITVPDAVLYILHEDFLNYFAPETSYRKLSELGIESDDEYFASAAESKLVAEAFPLDDPSEYYFAFKTCEVSKRDDPEYVQYYTAAVEAYYALLGTN